MNERMTTIVEISLLANRRGVIFFTKEFLAKKTKLNYLLVEGGFGTPSRIPNDKMRETVIVSSGLDGLARKAYCLPVDVPAVKKKMVSEVRALSEQTVSIWKAINSSAIFWDETWKEKKHV